MIYPKRIVKKGKRKVQGVPQSQTAALPRPQEEELEIIWTAQAKTCLQAYADSKGPDQPAFAVLDTLE